MDTQQEIDLHEQELASLLSRVLQAPLAPLLQSLGGYEQQLAAVESQFRELREVDVSWISEQQRESQIELKRLKSQTEDFRRALEARVGELLAGTQTQLACAQETALGNLHERLRQHSVEQNGTLAQTLDFRWKECGAQQERIAHDLRDVLIKQAIQLQQVNATESQRSVAGLREQLFELDNAVHRLEASGEAIEHRFLERQTHLVRMQEQSRVQTRDEIGAALRSVRRMLFAVLVLTGGSLATLVFVAFSWKALH